MKLRTIVESILNELVVENQEDNRKWREDSVREKFKIADDTVWMTLYHGTSVKNANNIVKTGFRDGAWFSPDYEVADGYSKRQTHGGKPFVMQCRVYIGSLLPSGNYLTAQEPLASTSQGYLPKDLVKKVYDMR